MADMAGTGRTMRKNAIKLVHSASPDGKDDSFLRLVGLVERYAPNSNSSVETMDAFLVAARAAFDGHPGDALQALDIAKTLMGAHASEAVKYNLDNAKRDVVRGNFFSACVASIEALIFAHYTGDDMRAYPAPP